MVNSRPGFRPLIPRLPASWHSCLLCENPAQGTALCQGCLGDLPWNTGSCERCALPLASGQNLCAACLQQSPAQILTLAPLRYEFPVDHLVAGLKYHGALAHAPLLGELLRRQLADRNHPAPDLLLPVPLHEKRLAERGYNQALEIARPLARHFGLGLETQLLQRCKATLPQMQLDAAARSRNPHGAFTVNAKRLQLLRASGRTDRVAVIDDVMTTGATLAEITGQLLHAGIAHVELWVVARTP
ncbi:MAG: ComF family protein [bacterium]|nr:ComF family protein [bacterium]